MQQRERPPAIARKKRLGVLIDSLETIYQRDILRGLTEAADTAGVSLWCFMGGCIPAAGKATEARHLVYDLAGPLNSDALILCSSTMIHSVGVSGLVAHCERYRPLPICSIGVELPGHTSVLVDNQIGMRRMVEHLITTHGLRRIACIRGPLGNEEAEYRLEAYRQALTDHKIDFDQQLVATGNFMEAGGQEAVRYFSHTLGSQWGEIEAIVASNDGMAFGAIRALNERNIVVPRDIKVTGFDDVEEAALAQPQLSTVRQPLVKQGQTALTLMLEQLQSGAQVPRTLLETELILRRSCGCDSSNRMVKYSAPPRGDFTFEAGVVFRRGRIVDGMTRAAKGDFGAAGHDW
jgi:phosphoserine phosphatase RsbU/P